MRIQLLRWIKQFYPLLQQFFGLAYDSHGFNGVGHKFLFLGWKHIDE